MLWNPLQQVLVCYLISKWALVFEYSAPPLQQFNPKRNMQKLLTLTYMRGPFKVAGGA